MQRGMLFTACVLTLLATAAGQCVDGQRGQEEAPKITLKVCKSPGSCQVEDRGLTIDANWRWTHLNNQDVNCYDGNVWPAKECAPDGDNGKKCAEACCLGGNTLENYGKVYGVKEIDNGVSMQFKNVAEFTWGTTDSTGSRLYMTNKDKYEMFKVVNGEFAFTADMSQLECGINGAVYFIEMEEDGGKGIHDGNKAGAKYGTGYCDAQCPHDMKFINGEANVKGWKKNDKDFSNNMGTGFYGACCNEMDIWEANARSQAYTPHPCTLNNKENKKEMEDRDTTPGASTDFDTLPGVHRCEGVECGDNDKAERYKGVCDKDGCDYANWRMGDQKAYGKGSEFEINTEKEFIQVTQFITHDGSDNGDLAEIRRYWKQGGKVVENAKAKHLIDVETPGRRRKFTCKGAKDNTLSDDICKSQNERFGDHNHFSIHGGLKEMGESLKRGHVLAISLWDDVEVSMMWLDSCWPRKKFGSGDLQDPDSCKIPGVSRGPCKGGAESTPKYVRKKYPDAVVKYWDFAVGCLGCTTDGVPKGEPARKPDEDMDKCPYSGGKETGGNDNNNDDDKDDSRRRSPRRRAPPRRRSERRRRAPPRRRSDRRRSPRRRNTTRRRSARRRSTRRRTSSRRRRRSTRRRR